MSKGACHWWPQLAQASAKRISACGSASDNRRAASATRNAGRSSAAARFLMEASGDDAVPQQDGCRLGGIAGCAGQQVAAVGEAKLYRIVFAAHC